jgi:hypothetical protein
MTIPYQTPRDLALKLFREADRTWNAGDIQAMADHFFNFCITHVALRDWVMARLGVPPKDPGYHKTWRAKADDLFGECADIANLSKHFTITKQTGATTAYREDLVALGPDGSLLKGSELQRDSYLLVRPSGDQLDFLMLFFKVCSAWEAYFASEVQLGGPLPNHMESLLTRLR